MLSKRTVVPLASMLTLDATPVELLPAPPAGYAYDIFDVMVSSNNVSVPFAAGGAQKIMIGSGGSGLDWGTVDLSKLSTALATVTNQTESARLGIFVGDSSIIGAPIMFGGGSVDLTGGDSPVAITIFYTLIALP